MTIKELQKTSILLLLLCYILLSLLLLENYDRQIGFLKEINYYSIKYQKKKDLLLFATILMEEYLMLVMLKSYLKRKNAKIGKTIKNSYWATRNFW